MFRSALHVTLCLILLVLTAQAQQPLQHIRGVVRDTAGTPLRGAAVSIAGRGTITNDQGAFRIDSLRPGHYTLSIRMVGFSPLRSRVAVVATEPTELEYLLVPAPLLLPTVVVEGRRTGIFGAVGDTGYRAIQGARIQVAGRRGGEMPTDSTGRFAFPAADDGQYVVRVTFPGYTERRVLVELKRGEGRELAVLLAPSSAPRVLADELALKDLGARLTAGLKRERLTADQLTRYGSMQLCEVPRIRAEIGRENDVRLAFSVNGVGIDTMADRARLCAWRADEVELVEFHVDVCSDVTFTVAKMAGIWCSGRSRNVVRSAMSGGKRVAGQGAGMRYVIVWEKK